MPVPGVSFLLFMAVSCAFFFSGLVSFLVAAVYSSFAGKDIRLRSVQEERYVVTNRCRNPGHHDGLMDRRGRWTAEVITNSRNQLRLRFRNCCGRHLAARLELFILDELRDDEAAQVRDARYEWALVPVGYRFLLRCFSDDFLMVVPELQYRAVHETALRLHKLSNCHMQGIHTLDQFLWEIKLDCANASSSSPPSSFRPASMSNNIEPR
ncbi:hypothetical protein C4D60_Mb04t18770 [Musa balbisiana]|uniref:Uncharacterized protein n=1 Tax=Musa balbisiana TaxID=52838 RepID=A0A4S8KD07_MUSBA|nr:hypothetical protein C4D60_Mb04t18770 [Musa balbisiana]